jgi:succinyldiaminopimelate transaminase
VPWDLLEGARARAGVHPDGIVDLSMGTPVDPVPEVVQAALAAASNAPGYPLTAGAPQLRAAIAAYLLRRCGVSLPSEAVLPTVGSKELVALLPTLLGLGPGDSVVIPSVCYPTYEVGALLCGARVIRSDSVVDLTAADRVGLVWTNSPGNPTGRVMPAQTRREIVAWAGAHGAVVAADECYLELGWEDEPSSILTDGGLEGILAVHSLSKRSNLAGYRAGFVAGDPVLIGELLTLRKHVGLIVPAPVQAAMIAALSDQSHVDVQRERYRERRRTLGEALSGAGFTIDDSTAGLYLWVTRGEPCWSTIEWFAERGILVSPGSSYGPAGAAHVRVALTASDERIRAAVARVAV